MLRNWALYLKKSVIGIHGIPLIICIMFQSEFLRNQCTKSWGHCKPFYVNYYLESFGQKIFPSLCLSKIYLIFDRPKLNLRSLFLINACLWRNSCVLLNLCHCLHLVWRSWFEGPECLFTKGMKMHSDLHVRRCSSKYAKHVVPNPHFIYGLSSHYFYYSSETLDPPVYIRSVVI